MLSSVSGLTTRAKTILPFDPGTFAAAGSAATAANATASSAIRRTRPPSRNLTRPPLPEVSAEDSCRSPWHTQVGSLIGLRREVKRGRLSSVSQNHQRTTLVDARRVLGRSGFRGFKGAQNRGRLTTNG